MTNNLSKHPRILAIAPSTQGFGFALLEGINILVASGAVKVRKDKNAKCVANIDEKITHYSPDLIVLEDDSTTRRAPRIRRLNKQIIRLAKKSGIQVMLVSRQDVRRAFFGQEKGTKYRLAVKIADQFPEELASKLPPKREAWKSEDARMNIFDAMALALMVRVLQSKDLSN